MSFYSFESFASWKTLNFVTYIFGRGTSLWFLPRQISNSFEFTFDWHSGEIFFFSYLSYMRLNIYCNIDLLIEWLQSCSFNVNFFCLKVVWQATCLNFLCKFSFDFESILNYFAISPTSSILFLVRSIITIANRHLLFNAN